MKFIGPRGLFGQKGHKGHILTLCFPRASVQVARVAKQTTSHDYIQATILYTFFFNKTRATQK